MRSIRVAVLLLYITFACALAVEKRGFEVRSIYIISNLPSPLKRVETRGTVQTPRRFQHLQRSDQIFRANTYIHIEQSNSDASTGPVTPPPPGSQTVGRVESVFTQDIIINLLTLKAETYHKQMMDFHGAFVPVQYQGPKIQNKLPSTLPNSVGTFLLAQKVANLCCCSSP
jgi:hypothetical protein